MPKGSAAVVREFDGTGLKIRPEMFLCVSPNPAIDKRLRIGALLPGKLNRALSAEGYPGGKAAHVAMVLRTLGATTQWAGFCGGSSGEDLVSGLRKLGIEAYHCNTAIQTRINLEIIDELGVVTEILEPGEKPSEEEIATFERQCKALFSAGGVKLWAIFSGSLPRGVGADFYARLISMAKGFGCSTALDTGGEPLRLALEQRPDFVKPNRDEASTYLGRKIDSVESAASAVRQLAWQGARSAAVSLGVDGMIYCAGKGGQILHAPAVQVAVQSTVGCGDSAVAGFVQSMAAEATPEDALRLATACAAANCLADSPGAARLEDILSLLKLVQVRRLPG